MRTSVIVPAHNEEKYLARTLYSVVSQGFPNLEIIVIPNACTDRTADIAAQFTDDVYDTKTPGISNAKNIGYEKATGDRIIFLDADSIMCDDLIADINTELQGRFVAGKTKIDPNNPTIPSQLYHAFVRLNGYTSQALMHLTPGFNSGSGACLFAERDILDKMKKEDGYVFNPHISSMTDVDFIARVFSKGPFSFLTRNGIITSTRRYDKIGYSKQLFIDFRNFIIRDERPNIR